MSVVLSPPFYLQRPCFPTVIQLRAPPLSATVELAAGAYGSQQPWTIQVDEPGDGEKVTEKKGKTSDLKVTAKKL